MGFDGGLSEREFYILNSYKQAVYSYLFDWYESGYEGKKLGLSSPEDYSTAIEPIIDKLNRAIRSKE